MVREKALSGVESHGASFTHSPKTGISDGLWACYANQKETLQRGSDYTYTTEKIVKFAR